jgi:hypothetical protein
MRPGRLSKKKPGVFSLIQEIASRMKQRRRPFYLAMMAILLLGAGAEQGSSLSAARAAAQSPARTGAARSRDISPLSVTAGGDTCAVPTVISSLPFNDSGDTTSATNDTLFLTSSCAGGGMFSRPGPDLIYSFTVAAGNSLTFTVTPTITGADAYDPAIYVLGTCSDGSTCVQAADSASNGQPETLGPISLASGTYYFYVDSQFTGDETGGSGPYTLSVAGTLGSPENAGFYTLPPCRLIDTRTPPGPPGGGPALVAGAQRTFTVVGRCSIPVGARAIAVNMAVTESTAPGNLILFPGGASVPAVSAINYGAGRTRANNGIVPLSVGGTIGVFVNQSSGTAHFILDVSGFFE